MIIFQIWKGSRQWLLRYECLKNFVVKSELDLIFDYSAQPSASPWGIMLGIEGYAII